MLIFPAIDLKDGHCVRLLRGDPDEKTIYSDDPVAMAVSFAADGAPWLHVVDLDAALSHVQGNRRVIRRILENVSAPVQVGGGIRSESDVDAVLGMGARRVVLGTAAVENPELVRRSILRYGPESIAVGIDAQEGRILIRGWKESSSLDAFEFAKRVAALGVRWVVYTDVSRDGTLGGPNLEATRILARSSQLSVIASGGIAALDDLVKLAALEPDGVAGAIVGTALYEGKFSLSEALQSVGRQRTDVC